MFFGEETMIAKHILRAAHQMGLMAGISIIWTANVNGQSIHPPNGAPLPDPQQLVTSFELQAIYDPATGKSFGAVTWRVDVSLSLLRVFTLRPNLCQGKSHDDPDGHFGETMKGDLPCGIRPRNQQHDGNSNSAETICTSIRVRHDAERA